MDLEVSVVSPEKVLFEGTASYINLSGKKGAFSVLPGHAPLIAELEPGLVEVNTKLEKLSFVIDGGFVEVNSNKVSALVEGAVAAQDVKPDVESQELQELLQKTVTGDEAMRRHQAKIDVRRARIRYALS